MNQDTQLFQAWDLLADAVIVSDRESRIVHCNAPAERLIGWPRRELVGRPVTELMSLRVRTALAQASEIVAGGGVPLRVPVLHRDGRELDVEVVATRLDDGGSVSVLRDLRHRVDVDQQFASKQNLLAAYGVMSVLTEAKTFDAAAPRVLATLGEALGWDVGLFWMGDPSTGALSVRASWTAPDVKVQAFVETSRRLTYRPGEGLLGQAWQTRQALWSLDVTVDHRYQRAEIAVQHGLKAALVFPVFCANEPHGVIEFLSRQAREPNGELLRTMATISFQIGQFLERSRTETELRQQRDHLQHLFDEAPAAIAIVTLPDYRYELSNPVNERFAGNRGLVGKTVREAWPELEQHGLMRMLDEVVRTRRPLTGKELPIEVSMPDGSKQLRFMDGVYQPMFGVGTGADVPLTGIMAFAYDVTEQVQARVRAEDSERRAAFIADALPQMVFVHSPATRRSEYNRRWYEYTGLSHELMGMPAWRLILHPDDLDRMTAASETVMATGEPFELDVRLRRASDQAYRWHLVRSNALRDAEGTVVQWIGSATDIDDQKRAEEANRFLGEASAILSTSLDYQTTLKTLANLVVPKLADWCSVYLQEPNEPTPKLLALVHSDPERLKWAQELSQRYPPDPKAPRGALAVARTGKPDFFPEISDALLVAAAKDADHLAMLREVGFSSAMTVPLTARGRTFGAISLIATESRRRFTEKDLAMAQELANRAATAVDNARLGIL